MATYYMPDNYANLATAFAAMSANDTLIIRDGTYTGTNNRITSSQAPPDGTGASFTTIMAEHDGLVTFDGQDTNNMFYAEYVNWNRICFRGINWLRNASQGVYTCPNSWGVDYSTYIKFIRCGSQGGSGTGPFTTWTPGGIQYLLMEECFSFGGGRYGFLLYYDDYVVLRRCVARLDKIDAGAWPAANFQFYRSVYGEFQNCIAINTDDDYITNASYYEGAFDSHESISDYVWWRGCIAIDNDWSQGYAGGLKDAPNHTLDNCVFIGIISGSPMIYSGVNSDLTIDHCTMVDITGTAVDVGDLVTNNILAYISDTANSGATGLNYNDFYGNGSNGTTGSNVHTDDPKWSIGNPAGALKYPVRIEAGSNLAGHGIGGTDIGANILYKYGTDGTFYGETGYNTLTSNSLWSFPYEDTIRTIMRAYNVSGGPSGTRGFCADGETLTHYIWNYLGNGGYPGESPQRIPFRPYNISRMQNVRKVHPKY